MDARKIRVATITLSDTRTIEDDEGGKLLGERLAAAGFEVVSHAIVREEPDAMRASVQALAMHAGVDAIVLTGGTGISPRDRTIEAIAPLFEKTLDGFGEAFRRLSWDEVGPRAMLSRAIAGTLNGRVIAALPGSPKAVRLAVDALLAPVLAHAVGLASGKGAHHHHGDKSAQKQGDPAAHERGHREGAHDHKHAGGDK